jgi:hypothetical protein
LFPDHNPDLPLIDGLGEKGMILRNPLTDNDDKFEFVVPWSLSKDGSVAREGRMIAGKRKFEEATWEQL